MFSWAPQILQKGVGYVLQGRLRWLTWDAKMSSGLQVQEDASRWGSHIGCCNWNMLDCSLWNLHHYFSWLGCSMSYGPNSHFPQFWSESGSWYSCSLQQAEFISNKSMYCNHWERKPFSALFWGQCVDGLTPWLRLVRSYSNSLWEDFDVFYENAVNYRRGLLLALLSYPVWQKCSEPLFGTVNELHLTTLVISIFWLLV